MTTGDDVDDLLVKDLLAAVMAACYRATGAPGGLAYLLCPVTSGPAELELMREVGAVDDAGNRTREVLRARLSDEVRWDAEYLRRVIEPNRERARVHAKRARRALAAQGSPAVVFDPTYVDVRAVALDQGIDLDLGRDRYLAVNAALLREHATHLVVCPGSEFGGALGPAVEDATSRGLRLISPNGSPVAAEEIAAARADARSTMRDMGFSPTETSAYMGAG